MVVVVFAAMVVVGGAVVVAGGALVVLGVSPAATGSPQQPPQGSPRSFFTNCATPLRRSQSRLVLIPKRSSCGWDTVPSR